MKALWIAAAVVLLAATGLVIHDRVVTTSMVDCVKERYGKEGAPLSDLPDCAAKWDAKFGHISSRALVADAPRPFGHYQAASVFSGACAPALLLLMLALLTTRKTTAKDWLISFAPALCLLLYVAAYYSALKVAEGGTVEGWADGGERLRAVAWLPLASAVLALMAGRRKPHALGH